MDFRTYYQSISDKMERRKIREKIINSTKIQMPTFYLWLRSNRVPHLAQEKISQIIGMPQSELFPDNE
jgi:hypothetical protein